MNLVHRNNLNSYDAWVDLLISAISLGIIPYLYKPPFFLPQENCLESMNQNFKYSLGKV